MEHPVPDFHPKRAESLASARRPGFDLRRKSPDFCASIQPRVRERIMKLSKVYSATATRDIHSNNRSGTCTTLELCNQVAMDGLIPQGSDG
jgi:hypothetical protein